MTEKDLAVVEDESAAAPATQHHIAAKAFQRISLLALLNSADITENHLVASTAILAVRGDWTRNHAINTREGTDERGEVLKDAKGEPLRDESDDPAPFTVDEKERAFLADFLHEFFEGKLKRTVRDPMGGTKTEVFNPNGRDTVELYPLYQKIKHK
jgi:hypothetical protein